jgi:hypothetical protein
MRAAQSCAIGPQKGDRDGCVMYLTKVLYSAATAVGST